MMVDRTAENKESQFSSLNGSYHEIEFNKTKGDYLQRNKEFIEFQYKPCETECASWEDQINFLQNKSIMFAYTNMAVDPS